MGFFSFLDASTKESIRVDSDVSLHVPGASLGPVPEKFLERNTQYKSLLLPNQITAMTSLQGSYDGYGHIHIHTPAAFSGLSLDVYVCLYVMNFASLPKGTLIPDEVLTEEEARSIGLMIDMGSYFQDKDGNNHHYHGHYHVCDPNRLGVKSTPFNGSFDTPQDPSGKTPNDLIQSGEWVEKQAVPTIPFPLKLTLEPEDKNGDRYKYEELNASEDCPNQGWFYERGFNR